MTESACYRAPPVIRFQYAVQYLGLAGFLSTMAFETYGKIPPH